MKLLQSSLVLLLCTGALFAAEHPLLQAHAHNDYEHARPLLDALGNGFCSVEADIHLSNGVLLVGHDAADLKPERTLEKLYLHPLAERVKKNAGRVYKDGPPVILLVDVKTEADSTYAALEGVLRNYRSILTEFRPDKIQTNAVTVIISGNRARERMLNEKERWAAYDGRLVDLGKNYAISFMPLVSDNWTQFFKWRGEGSFPEDERVKLKDLVGKARAENRMLRFWGTADTPAMWQVLKEAGVDLINTDKLAGLKDFLTSK
jgi:hypothetical protein